MECTFILGGAPPAHAVCAREGKHICSRARTGKNAESTEMTGKKTLNGKLGSRGAVREPPTYQVPTARRVGPIKFLELAWDCVRNDVKKQKRGRLLPL